MTWVGYIARKDGRGIFVGYWLESQKERDHQEDVNVSIILRWIFER
jgi:hypothetical protein